MFLCKLFSSSLHVWYGPHDPHRLELIGSNDHLTQTGSVWLPLSIHWAESWSGCWEPSHVNSKTKFLNSYIYLHPANSLCSPLFWDQIIQIIISSVLLRFSHLYTQTNFFPLGYLKWVSGFFNQICVICISDLTSDKSETRACRTCVGTLRPAMSTPGCGPIQEWLLEAL